MPRRWLRYHPPEGQVIDPAQEQWQVYVPEDYDGSTPYGVLVWVAPWDVLGIPSGWQSALEGAPPHLCRRRAIPATTRACPCAACPWR